MNKKWWHNSVIYQIYPRSFNDSNNDGLGDIKGITQKLDYLSDLGVNVLWLSPLYKSPMKDNGYDISDYRSVDPIFGTNEDLEELFTKSKERNIRIVMDLVVNHTSDQHEWFLESKKSKDNPYRDYYIWRDEPNDLGSVFGGSAWTYDDTTNQYYFHQFAKEQPDLNWENEKVIQEIIDMINYWLEKGIGGFRLDVIDLIGKEVDKKILGNGPKLHPLLQRLHRESWGNYDVITVGETWGATPEIATLYSDPKRNELSMIFQFEHITKDWGEFGKWKVNEFDFISFKQILSKWQTELTDGWNSLFWNNHDLPRVVSRWGNDTVYRVESAKLLATTLHLMKGTPYIYQGEEIGMTNVKFETLKEYNDVEIHGSYKDYVVKDKSLTHEEFMDGVYKMGRDNARTPMQWNSFKNGGFSNETPWLKVNPNYVNINVEEALNDKDSIYYTYKELISLRKNDKYKDLLLYGKYELLFESDPNLFVYRRYNDTDEILLVGNYSEELRIDPYYHDDYEIIYSNYKNSTKKLRPYEVKVYRVK